MNEPVSGDILPATEAIDLIDQVDLTPPLEIPPAPAGTDPDNVSKKGHRNFFSIRVPDP